MLLRRCSALTTAAALIVVGLLSGEAAAQVSLPAGWQQLDADAFVASLSAVYEPDEDIYIGTDTEATVRQHAATMFGGIDVATTQLSYRTLYWIYALAYPKLDADAHEPVRDALVARQDNWASRPYEDLRSKQYFMWRASAPGSARAAELQAWIAAGGSIDDIWAEDLSLARKDLMAEVKMSGDFQIEWSGSITAPATGAYTFSVSPINISARDYSLHDRYDVMQTITVSVNGQEVISATPDDWAYVGAPVQLTQGQAVPLQVNMTIESERLPPWAVHAQLYWSGPGVAQAVVPADRLTPPSGQGEGLQQVVSWEQDGEPQTLTQTVPNIDYAWIESVSFVNDLDTLQQIADRMWSELMAPVYLAAVTGGPKRHAFVDEGESANEIMTSAQRRQFMATVQQSPEMLDHLKLKEMVDVYRSFRLGAPAEALDAFALWAERHADATCRMPQEYENSMKYFREFLGFNFYNHKAYRLLAICVGIQLPEHAERLLSDDLELEDGRCCLPVAYTLAYAFLTQERFDDWVALLDARLADPGLTGDTRVNWLLARAMAAEMRLLPTNIYADGKLRPMDGMPWVDEAAEAAQTPETQVRVAREKGARLASIQKYDEANAVLADAGQGVSQALQDEVAVCLDCVSRFQAWNAAAEAAHAQASQDNYVDELRARRDRATAAGDANLAARYDTLIQAAEQ